MAAAYGVEYRWPLWDVRLVQQYLSTPSIEKVGPKGIGCYLHRRAISSLVPKAVAWKLSNDMGYSAAIQKKQTHNLPLMVKRAKALEADLHTDLIALVDRNRLRAQIKEASSGEKNFESAFFFMRSVSALHQLDRLLKGHTA